MVSKSGSSTRAPRRDVAAGGEGHATVFVRIGRNIGWLLGGRAFSAIVSIAYLAIAARALGPARFGGFVLVLTYAQLIANLVQFQSWKGVIRFGAIHLAQNRPERLARLLGFTATLDWASAAVGAVIAIVAVPFVAPLLHWSGAEQGTAAIFGAVLLLSTGATPTGMLRLFDRFDLLTYTEAIAPLVRLLGSIAAWWLGGGIVAFLLVWGLAACGQTIGQWVAALFIRCSRIAIGRRSFALAVNENSRLWRFMLQTNISNSLSLFWLQTGTLAVGSVAGAVQAGGFRIADRMAKGVIKPVETLTRALYPEMARLVATDERMVLRKVLIRTSWIAAGFSFAIVGIAGFAGGPILALVAGKEFEFASGYLFLLAISAAIDLTGFALEPFHNAHGRSGRVLRSRAVGAAVYAALLAILLPSIGAEGAAFASIGASSVMFLQLAASTAQILGIRK
jgi:O-antigen/teichoic acid export membrane protein